MIDTRHELVRLAALIDWSWFEEHWAGFFPSPEGRPALHPRLVAGLMCLRQPHGLSDEAVLARWVENPYFQHFTGEAFFKTLKAELVWRTVFQTRAEAHDALARYIDAFYSPIRRHSALDYVSPAQFERRAADSTALH